MKARLLQLWQSLHTSFWFVPTLMVVAAAALPSLLEVLDVWWEAAGGSWPDWLVAYDVDNARQILATIAASMITVAGVTFSIVIVALSLASSQFGPRQLINFMRDTGNQVVLGTFVATFVYCIVVLRQMGGSGAAQDALPQLAVVTAVALSLVSLGVLIYFFDHVSTSIQAGSVVATAGALLERAVAGTYPKRAADGGGPVAVPSASEGEIEPWPVAFDAEARPVLSRHTGYLNVLDLAALVEAARRADVVVRLEVREGDFLIDGSPIARVFPGTPIDERLDHEIREAFRLVDHRGMAEDLWLATERLTEVAIRALSPAINDPFTAIACIDRLAAGLSLLAARDLSWPDLRDRDGRVRVRRGRRFGGELIDAPCQQIRLYGGDNPQVLERLLEMLRQIALRTNDHELRQAIARQVEMTETTARDRLVHAWERDRLALKSADVRKVLDG